MVFSLNELKDSIRDTLRVYLYPNNTVSDTDLTLSDSLNVYKVSQSFKPYSKCYNTVTPYRYTVPVDVKLKKLCTPDGDLVVSLQSSNTNNQPSGTTVSSFTIAVGSTSTTFDVHNGNMVLTNMLGSATNYHLVLEPKCSASTVNCYITQMSTVNKYIIGSMDIYNGSSWSSTIGDLYFDFDVPNFIYTDYPRSELSKWSFPRIAIDMISRRVDQRWINTEFADYIIDFTVVAYSAYPNELDDLLSYSDRAIFKERTAFTNMRRIDTGELTPVVVLRDNLFSRAIRYTIIYRMTNT